MMTSKDELPGTPILMLDAALSTLDRATEAQSIEIAREEISVARKEINQVLTLAREAANADAS
jgi:hypothetical protein